MSEKLPRIIATFQPQAWIRDHAVDIDYPEEFDCTETVLAMPADDIIGLMDNSTDSDILAECAGFAERHPGPYRVIHEGSVEEFLAANGMADHSLFDEEAAEQLRRKYGVAKGSFPNSKPALQIVTYRRFGVDVHVMGHLKGRHAEHCLCWTCVVFNPDTPEKNCPIAQELFEFDKRHHVTTPVWECPKFEKKA